MVLKLLTIYCNHPFHPQGLPNRSSLCPIHRPLYPSIYQSLTKGDLKSGVIFDPAPAVWELVPLPFLGAFLVLRASAQEMLFCLSCLWLSLVACRGP